MKAEYDLSQMKSRKNPYASKLKKSVTIRLAIEKLILLGSQLQSRFKVIGHCFHSKNNPKS
jgi:hypothetical protein